SYSIFFNDTAPTEIYTLSLHDALPILKKKSSAWAKDNFDRRFTWQEGYAAFTVSPTATDSVRRYIATQEAHHRKHSFVDELRELDRKSTRLNSSHVSISYAVFCLKKKK